MKYFNEYIGSDSYPYELVREISEQTVEIRRMKSERDPSWKPEMHPGGFVAHCSNQSSQRWFYESDPTEPTLRIRRKKTQWTKFIKWGKGDRIFTETDKPLRFYDYNF